MARHWLAWALVAAPALAVAQLTGTAQPLAPVANPGTAVAVTPLLLRDSVLLQDALDPSARRQMPAFVSGDRIYGQTDVDVVITGQAKLRKADVVIQADYVRYQQAENLATVQGNVRLNRAGNVYEGPLLQLHLDSFEGFFNTPSYHFLRNGGHGQAERVDFLDDQHTQIHNASFTTCKRVPGSDWMPAWILRASTLNLDNETDTGTATGALLSFKGVPLLPVPYISFPLSDRRKSGVLPPSIGIDTVNGTELSLPYYWNMAPNRDATLTPTLMSKRGVQLASEFRYLEAAYQGVANVNWMPNDSLRSDSRWGVNLTHQGHFNHAWTDTGAGLSLNLNRVSDDNYWRDFTRANVSLTQRLLANDAVLGWSNGNGAFSSMLRALKWQTLQDVNAPIVPPYDRAPQLATRYANADFLGLDVALKGDYTRFEADPTRTLQPNTHRLFSQLQVSKTLQNAAAYLRPKFQLHASHYQFDQALADGALSTDRFVPTVSLDTGVVFERDTHWMGQALTQTLEPRVFYVNTPFREQNNLPNYDSGAYDFNLATIYQENAFVGNDRISDSDVLTLGLSSRILDGTTGMELVRVGVAQRLRFRDQNVVLPGAVAVQDRFSDFLVGGSVSWDSRWRADTTVQLNAETQRSVRSTISARYSPGSYRTVSASYRFQRDISEQIDIGWQWPLNDLWGDNGQSVPAGQGQGTGRWYSVGRVNYSMNERKLVDSVLGFEYDAGCWLGRLVLERLQTSTSTATQRLMFQLEFVGFSRLGVNPLQSLRANIPGYQILREPTPAPSRFSNYD